MRDCHSVVALKSQALRSLFHAKSTPRRSAVNQRMDLMMARQRCSIYFHHADARGLQTFTHELFAVGCGGRSCGIANYNCGDDFQLFGAYDKIQPLLRKSVQYELPLAR